MSDLKQIVVERGVITFDGQVVETFGFGKDSSQRVDVAILTEEEFKSTELADLLDAIRAAAPNLKESS